MIFNDHDREFQNSTQSHNVAKIKSSLIVGTGNNPVIASCCNSCIENTAAAFDM